MRASSNQPQRYILGKRSARPAQIPQIPTNASKPWLSFDALMSGIMDNTVQRNMGLLAYYIHAIDIGQERCQICNWASDCIPKPAMFSNTGSNSPGGLVRLSFQDCGWEMRRTHRTLRQGAGAALEYFKAAQKKKFLVIPRSSYPQRMRHFQELCPIS